MLALHFRVSSSFMGCWWIALLIGANLLVEGLDGFLSEQLFAQGEVVAFSGRPKGPETDQLGRTEVLEQMGEVLLTMGIGEVVVQFFRPIVPGDAPLS